MATENCWPQNGRLQVWFPPSCVQVFWGKTLKPTLLLVVLGWCQFFGSKAAISMWGWINGTVTVKRFGPSKKAVYTIYLFNTSSASNIDFFFSNQYLPTLKGLRKNITLFVTPSIPLSVQFPCILSSHRNPICPYWCVHRSSAWPFLGASCLSALAKWNVKPHLWRSFVPCHASQTKGIAAFHCVRYSRTPNLPLTRPFSCLTKRRKWRQRAWARARSGLHGGWTAAISCTAVQHVFTCRHE